MAEQKNKKVEEQVDNKPIDGQVVINEDGIAEIRAVEETADTVKLEMPNGEQVDVDKTELEMPEEIASCADHISRTKVLDVINRTMAKYEGKVVLAMSEVRDIIKAITTAVNE